MTRTRKEQYAYVALARIERDELTGDVTLRLIPPDSDVEVTPGAEFARVALAQNPWRE